MKAVEFDSVSKDIKKKRIVSDFSFHVNEGRTFALLGPNGSGKTTTVRLLTGLISPSSGRIKIFGEELSGSNAPGIRNRIGVQTDSNLYLTLSVEKNLSIWGDLFGLEKQLKLNRIEELLVQFDLIDRKKSLVSELSKGMKQKLAVARALIADPDLIILDEPTAGMDPEATENLVKYLKDIVANKKKTLIICTHQLHGLDLLANDMCIINKGKMITYGEVNQLIEEKWRGYEYDINVKDFDKSLDVINGLDIDSISHDAKNARIRVNFDEVDIISKVVDQLVAKNCGVLSVAPVKHTLRDYYFSTL